MYAQLCKRLSEEAANFENSSQKHQTGIHHHGMPRDLHQPRTLGGGGGGGGLNNQQDHQLSGTNKGSSSYDSVFKRLLLNKCRFEFENRSKANEAFERLGPELSPEDEERRQSTKRKMLGNIKFIGELGKLEIVSHSILHKCIQQLLDKRRDGSRGDQAEDIECLCQIMRTCGRILDTDKGAQLMEQYFKRMSSLAKSNDLPLRIRFMLRDVIELRRDNWVPRKATSTEGPMPINQIRNDNDDSHHHHHQRSAGGIPGSIGGPGGYYNHRNHRGGDDPRGGAGAGLGDDLFRRMGRLDVSSIIPLSSPNFSITSPFSAANGFGGGPGGNGGGPGGANYGRHNQRNQPNPGGFYNPNQNRHQNNYQGGKHNQQQHNSPQNSYNNNGNKEPVRFNKNKMVLGPSEEVSLRPSANSMTFSKKPNITPNMPLNNGNSLTGGIDLFANNRILNPENLALQRSVSAINKPSPPLPIKEAPASIVIKQGPLDKREKARERKDKGPTKEDIMKKVNTMMDEFISKGNIPEGITGFKELKIAERFLRYAVFTIYTNSCERNDAERNLAADLVSQMRKESVVNNQQFHDGWKELVNSIADKETGGVPCIASHVAQLTARAITDNMLQLSDLASVTENGQNYPLFLLTLQQLHKTQGKTALLQIFNDSKVNLISQLPEAEKTKERLGEILEDRDLTFLYPLLRIQGDMWKQLESDPAPNSLYKWIKEKLDPSHHSDPGFINALISVLLKYITQETTFPTDGGNPSVVPDKSIQEKELALLSKYQRMLQTLLPTIESQVTAVHSLQVFCLSLNFPKGMLLRWFISLYDLSIIDEDAFMRWKEDVNDAYPGKGEALFQVNAWLTWLADQPSEDEDEEEEEKGDN